MRETERARMEGTVLCAVSNQLDMCDLCLLYVSIGNASAMGSGQAGSGWDKPEIKKKMKNKILLPPQLRYVYIKRKRVTPTYLICKQ